ncbi:hypothetical protein LCGC14_1678320 [marine sediment metagenome]|uniref:Uncharacterized protein n=1 Tax=marine sediment metagenome TaxID=412755 RepID=A0A0F9KPB5_9ZZZZ
MADVNEAVRSAALRMDAALSRDERVLVGAKDLSLVLEALASTWPPKKVRPSEQWPPREISVGVELARLVGDALACEGEHHIRWYLEQLADVLDVPVNERTGIAP